MKEPPIKTNFSTFRLDFNSLPSQIQEKLLKIGLFASKSWNNPKLKKRFIIFVQKFCPYVIS